MKRLASGDAIDFTTFTPNEVLARYTLAEAGRFSVLLPSPPEDLDDVPDPDAFPPEAPEPSDDVDPPLESEPLEAPESLEEPESPLLDVSFFWPGLSERALSL